MSTIDDIANWVLIDVLSRSGDTNIQSVCRNAALNVYRVVAAKVPFDELQFTSPELPLIANQDTYIIGSDIVLAPTMRAIANIRITFDSTNKRRLRRSAARIFDALSFTSASRPSTYARWDNTIQLNPPPDSSAYTWRFRYWGRPPIGQSYAITNITWVGGVATYTIGANAVVDGHNLVVVGANPNGYNVGGVAAGTVAGSSTNIAITTNPGTYVGGGILYDTSLSTSGNNFANTILLTPVEWDELLKWETLYRVYYALDQPEKAMSLFQPGPYPNQQGSPRKKRVFEAGLIPRLWNDLLSTISQNENVDEDFSVNPVIRPYSMR